jgi:hypothetical protein
MLRVMFDPRDLAKITCHTRPARVMTLIDMRPQDGRFPDLSSIFDSEAMPAGAHSQSALVIIRLN